MKEPSAVTIRVGKVFMQEQAMNIPVSPQEVSDVSACLLKK